MSSSSFIVPMLPAKLENRSIALFEEKKAPDSVFVFVVIPIVK